MTGTGAEPPCDICAPVISVDTGTGSHAVEIMEMFNCSAQQNILIQNQGDLDLDVTQITVKNDSFSSCGTFSVSWDGATTLGPWESTTAVLQVVATEQLCYELAWASLDENVLHILSSDPWEPDYVVELTAIVACLI